MRRSGMTLVELLVVLTILAVLTTIAVSLTDNVLEQAKFDATQRTLDNVRTALIGSGNPQDPLAGYIADVGTAPTALTDLTGGTNTSSIPAYAVYTTSGTPAIGMLPVTWSPADSTAQKTLSTIPITLAAGLRSPYLRLPANTSLADGWGSAFNYSGPAGNPLVITSSGRPLNNDLTASPYAVPISLSIPTTNFSSTVTVSLTPFGGSTAAAPAQPANVVLFTVNNGVVTAVSAQALGSAPSLTNGYSVNFTNVPYGNRAVIAYQTVGSTTNYSAVTYLRVTGGAVTVPLSLVLQ